MKISRKMQTFAYCQYLTCMILLFINNYIGGKILNNNQTKSTLTTFLGFLFTFLLLISLFTEGILISLKTGALKGDSFTDIYNNCNVNEIIKTAAINELASNTTYELSEDALNTIFSTDLINNTSDYLIDSIVSGKDVDLTQIKDDCADAAASTSELIVDEFIDSINASGGKIDISDISNNPVATKFSSDFNVDIDEALATATNDITDTTLDLATIDTKELKKELNQAVTEKVLPVVDSTLDDFISKAQQPLNNSLRQLRTESGFSNALKTVDKTISTIPLFIVLFGMISLFFFAIQFAFYRKLVHKPIKNLSITFLLSGIVLTICGLVVTIIKTPIYDKLVSANPLEKAVADSVLSILETALTPFLITGVIYIVLSIATMICSISLKKKIS